MNGLDSGVNLNRRLVDDMNMISTVGSHPWRRWICGATPERMI